MDLFDAYDIFLLNCDAENKELILLGNINSDVGKSPPEAHTIRFQSINTLYNMAQLIEEPTRVARTSATIIDLIGRQMFLKKYLMLASFTLVYQITA
jgi:hypothetical protein